MLRTEPYKLRFATRRALAACILGLVCPLSVAAPSKEDAPAGPPLEAIWQVQYLPFEFNGMRTLYACDSLERKIRNILQAAGAHRSVAVKARCSGGEPIAHAGPLSGDLVSQISATIAVASPVQATDENIVAATTFNTHDEMIAKIKKKTLPNPANLERFAAEWRNVSLTRARRVKLDVADCDLLVAMNDQLFAKMGVALLGDRPACNKAAQLTRPEYGIRALIQISLESTATKEPPTKRL